MNKKSNMKKPLLLLIIILSISFITLNSCERLDKLVSFNLSVSNQFFIPVFDESILYDEFEGNETISYFIQELKFSDNEAFEKNKTNPTKVKSTDIQSFTLSIDSGSVSNFNKMKKIEIFAGGGVTQDKLIASQENIQFNAGSLSLKVEITNEVMKEIMQKDLYVLKLAINWQAPIEDPVYLKFIMNFRIKSIPTE
jgi:hypothetical protein